MPTNGNGVMVVDQRICPVSWRVGAGKGPLITSTALFIHQKT